MVKEKLVKENCSSVLVLSANCTPRTSEISTRSLPLRPCLYGAYSYPVRRVPRHDELKTFLCLYEQRVTRVSSGNASSRERKHGASEKFESPRNKLCNDNLVTLSVAIFQMYGLFAGISACRVTRLAYINTLSSFHICLPGNSLFRETRLAG